MKYLFSLAFPVLFILFTTEIAIKSSSETIISQEWLLTIHPEYRIDEVLIALENDKNVVLKRIKQLSGINHIYLVSSKGNIKASQLKAQVFAHPLVKYFSKNIQVHFRDKRPNDPRYDVNQWDMEVIGAPAAWEHTTGGKTPNGDDIVVAVIDQGFQLEHPDLQGNFWIFEDEIAGDGIDNDGNGFIDDVLGWDAEDQAPLPSVQSFHGTGVVGIIGAKGNNDLGVTGINWNVKILPISVQNTGNLSAVFVAYDYVIRQRALYNNTNGEKGAYIIVSNSSFGADNTRPEDFPEWCEFYNTMGETGILSVASTTNKRFDVDEVGDLPSNCTSKYLIAVTSTSMDDSYSGLGFGTTSVDMAAPGNETFTTTSNSNYNVLGSNSSASPHVAGALALIYSLDCKNMAALMLSDRESYMEILKNAIFEGTDQKTDLQDKTVTGGRLNIANSIGLIIERCDDVIDNGDYSLNLYPNPADEQITIDYQSPNTDEQSFKLINSNGTLIRNITHSPLISGAKKKSIQLVDLPPGTYYISMSKDDGQISAPFIITHQ